MSARRAPAGTDDLVGGLAGGLFAPLAAFGFGLPLWVALPAAVAVFLGTRLALAPRARFAGLDPAAAGGVSLDLAREVLDGAAADLDRLAEAARGVHQPELRARLERLHAIGARVVTEVERQPQRLAGVRRLLTYYLPAAARLGEGFRVLDSAHRPDPARREAAAGMIARLDDVFSRHADRLNEVELDGLDVELKLLADAIGAEERASQGTPPWR